MRYFLWISEKEGDEYCSVYREDKDKLLWRWEDDMGWKLSGYKNLKELAGDASRSEELLLEAK